MQPTIGKRKRGLVQYSKDLNAARSILGVEHHVIGVNEKVYPATGPENPKQYIDVEDTFDLRFEQSNQKRRFLNFATRCRIIEL